jgi:hypothetical protein
MLIETDNLLGTPQIKIRQCTATFANGPQIVPETAALASARFALQLFPQSLYNGIAN